MQTGKLLFSHKGNLVTDPKTKKRYNNTSAELFHKKCDNKGPTITVVSANHGFIFGAYNPASWIPSFCYTEAKDSFLFCVRRPRGIMD